MGSIRTPYAIGHPELADPRARGRWWIDDHGRFIEHSKIGFNRDARRTAFRFMGMVEIIAERTALRVRWDVASASNDAIIAAGLFLSTRLKSARVTLEFYWGAWNLEILTQNSNALSRMSELASFRKIEPFKGIKRAVRPIENVREEGDLLRHSFELWERNKSCFNADAPRSLGQMAPYALSFRSREDDGQLIFDHIGEHSSSSRIFGPDWARDALGRSCDRSQPDYEFADRVCDAYHDVLESGAPMVDHIRGIIRRDGVDPIWVPYRRLVVPTRNRLGAPIVVSICDIRQDLAIPFMTATQLSEDHPDHSI